MKAEESQIETQHNSAPVSHAGLIAACRDLLADLRDINLPLALPDADNQRAAVAGLRGHLADYVLPRLSADGAPLLIVVGGSTGAGKSTLVNSLVGEDVSETGVVRPTTRRPVLVHHPDDARHFTDFGKADAGESGAGQPGSGPADSGQGQWNGLDPIVRPHAGVPAGIALLDAPDIDSVDPSNRAFARRLTAAADLWLFTTTATRYADAEPWKHLKQATSSGSTLAVVLDRVPHDSARTVRRHLSEMLVAAGLESTPLFIVPEVQREGTLLPVDAIAGVKSWVDALGANPRARALVARRTLRGTGESIAGRVNEVAAFEDAQVRARTELAAVTDSEFAAAADSLTTALTSGEVVRGEVLARWQDFIGTGQFFLGLESSLSRIRSRVTAAISGNRDAATPLGEAIRGGLADLIREGAAGAVAAVNRAWRGLPAGTGLKPGEAGQLPGSEREIGALLREWTGHVQDIVREEARGKRTKARILSFGIDGVAVVLMLAVVAGTADADDGAGAGAGGDTARATSGGTDGGTGAGETAGAPSAADTAAMAERLLTSLFGDQIRRELTDDARSDLRRRVQDLLTSIRKQFDDVTDAVDVDADRAARLRESGRRFQENQ